jgi:pimeloyl-ACP methyl ester carboxylesterase
MSVVTLEGEFVHYEVLGRGRPLIFMHGWVGSWRYWIPTMQAASFQFRTYSLDLWGFGDTSKNTAFYTLEQQVTLLSGFLESMGIGKIAMVGHGLGAVVALMFASRFPATVDRVMVTGYPQGSDKISTRLRTAPLTELADWLLGKLPLTEAARVEAPKADPQAILSSLDDLQNLDLAALSQNLQTPCLWVHGQNDPMVEAPPLDGPAQLPERTHYIAFEQSGHFPMLDDPNKYNRLLGDFLALPSGESPRQLQLKEEWKRRMR